MKKRKAETITPTTEVSTKKKFTIGGVTLGRLFSYFVIYSFVGFVIETLFGLVTKGVLESRQSFLYGPFCSIYGIGAIIMIPALNRFKKNNISLFVGGFFIGSLVEYLLSLAGEILLNMRWWDYSDMAFNINGRICIAYSFFWGILAIYLMKSFNPKVDKLIDRIPVKYVRSVTIIGVVFLILDAAVTGFALKIFFTRLVNNYGLEIKDVNQSLTLSKEALEIDWIQYLSEHHFSDRTMIRTFPNLKLLDKDNNVILVRDILSDIDPYYLHVFTPKSQPKP